jgi:hypothetical protein
MYKAANTFRNLTASCMCVCVCAERGGGNRAIANCMAVNHDDVTVAGEAFVFGRVSSLLVYLYQSTRLS